MTERCDEELRMVMVGKTGSGKSTTGNIILGCQHFDSRCSATSITKMCNKGRGSAGGQKIVVIDTPGLCDTDVDEETTKTDVSQCISYCSPGPHVFLVVVRVGRFTKEEKLTVQKIQEMFGDAADRYSMVLFTHGDLLKDSSIQNYMKDSAELQELVHRCNGRYHVFSSNNDPRQQVTELLQKVRYIVYINGGGHYTNEMFQRAERAIQDRAREIMMEKKAEMETEKKEMQRKLREELEEKMREVEKEERRDDEQVPLVRQESVSDKIERMKKLERKESEERERKERIELERNKRIERERQERMERERIEKDESVRGQWMDRERIAKEQIKKIETARGLWMAKERERVEKEKRERGERERKEREGRVEGERIWRHSMERGWSMETETMEGEEMEREGRMEGERTELETMEGERMERERRGGSLKEEAEGKRESKKARKLRELEAKYEKEVKFYTTHLEEKYRRKATEVAEKENPVSRFFRRFQSFLHS